MPMLQIKDILGALAAMNPLVMGANHDSGPPISSFDQQLQDQLGMPVILKGRGLICQQEIRPIDQGPGEPKALALSCRDQADRLGGGPT
jgi:hypothetical protein